jgi:hypothetical protein
LLGAIAREDRVRRRRSQFDARVFLNGQIKKFALRYAGRNLGLGRFVKPTTMKSEQSPSSQR